MALDATPNDPREAPYRQMPSDLPLRSQARRVPLLLQVMLVLGRRHGRKRWIVLALASLLAWSAGAHLVREWCVASSIETVDGEVDAVAVGRDDEARVHFHFRYGGETWQSDAITRKPAPHPGATLPVAIPEGDPDHAILVGMREYHDAPGTARFALVFLGLALAVVGAAVARGARDVRLLAVGQLAPASFAERVPSVWRSSRSTDRLHYLFADAGGQLHRVVERAPRRGDLLGSELSIHDPVRPRHAALLVVLPGRPRVAADGSIGFDASFTTVAAQLALPFLVLVANVLASHGAGLW